MTTKPNIIIGLWNANGIRSHTLELSYFLENNFIDVMLICETRLNSRLLNPSFKGYLAYYSHHPDGTSHGGTAILIKDGIEHTRGPSYSYTAFQSTSIVLKLNNTPTTIAAFYNPPNQNFLTEDYISFFKSLGNKFIVGADFNAKHKSWGSKSITTKGRRLLKALQSLHLNTVSTGQPTYWPSDKNKSPDLIDFFVTKGVSCGNSSVRQSFDLSSDHSPLWLDTSIAKPCSRNKTQTNWSLYRQFLTANTPILGPMRDQSGIDFAVSNFSSLLLQASRTSSEVLVQSQPKNELEVQISRQLGVKRCFRRRWQATRCPQIKVLLNKATHDLRKLLHRREINLYRQLRPDAADSEFSLWKFLSANEKKTYTPHQPPIKCVNGDWARTHQDKADRFASHLAEVFSPNPSVMFVPKQRFSFPNLDASHRCKLKWKYTKSLINDITNKKKAPGLDEITGAMIRNLPDPQTKALHRIFVSTDTGYFPTQWKTAKVVMIPKKGKDPHVVSSYRPISLLSVLSKLFERFLMGLLDPFTCELLPEHQFGFRAGHNSINQVHRVISTIRNTFEKKQYCSAAFLDISQAFDRVWLDGLMAKITLLLPPRFHRIICNYLQSRDFVVRVGSATSNKRPMSAGVPQGSVLGPLLYILYTYDLPSHPNTNTCTFADDTAIMARSSCLSTASSTLQEHLDLVSAWADEWGIAINKSKSVHTTFSLRPGNCTSVSIDNVAIPQKQSVLYLGIHLDRRLTWREHVESKIRQARLVFNNLSWTIGGWSKLPLEARLELYRSKTIPIWTYGIELWSTCSPSLMARANRCNARMVRTLCGAPWYVRTDSIFRDLHLQQVNCIAARLRARYIQKLAPHTNPHVRALLMGDGPGRIRRLNSSTGAICVDPTL